MSVGHHKSYAPKTVACRVLTVSDTRTPETDTSGLLIVEKLTANNHTVIAHAIVPDEVDQIEDTLKAGIDDPKTDAIIITGGTGIAPRDVTIEAVEGLITKGIPGFGEIFRALSFEEIGPAAMASRATAGTAGDTLIFATPGSRGAVALAMERLILPEIAHLIGQMRRSKKAPAKN